MAKSGVAESVIREGFLCPICLCDLKTVYQLQDHFELTHPTEDNDVFQALKGFIDKAKRKILKQDTTWTEELSKDSFEIDASYKAPLESPEWPEQDIGVTFSHLQSFKKLRDKKIDIYVLETNTLLIRLYRLIFEVSDEDPENRKAYEKKIVPWIPDADVALCPGCAKSFGLSRRRHHCRLCGGVMCQACSVFLDHNYARKLTVQVVSDDQRLMGNGKKSNPVKRRPSSAGIMSVVNVAEQQIRICKDCSVLLQRYEKLLDRRSYRPTISQMYERLKEFKDEIEKLTPTYLEMLESLNSGETDYQLQNAKDLHLKISNLAAKVDSQSKRILHEANNEEKNSRTMQLYSGIRMAATQFLRNVVLGLPSPPSEEEISHYQTLRLQQVQRRIQLEKQAEMLSQIKETSKSQSPVATPKHTVVDPVSPDEGWCGYTQTFQEEEDPMLQQIKIISKYIQQARTDHKYDEVKMLENNLKELQLEYSKQKKKHSEG